MAIVITTTAPPPTPGPGDITASCQSACSPWATRNDITRLLGTAAASTPRLAEFLGPATDLLFEATGRRWAGSCIDTARPCARLVTDDRRFAFRGGLLDIAARSGADGGYGFGFWDSTWGFCRCNQPRMRGDSRHNLSEIALGVDVLTSVTKVLIDGAELDPSKYRVDDNHWLVRLPDTFGGPTAYWQCCQRMDLPSTEVDTWEVTFTYGVAPPTAGVLAAATLAVELAKGAGSGDCALPPRITQLVKQGVSVALIDPLVVVEKGGFGLYAVDVFLKQYGARPRSAVYVPGRKARVRRTG